MSFLSTALQTHYDEAVYYLQLSSQKFLVSTISGVSGLSNLTIALPQEMPQYQPMKHFEYIGQVKEEIIPLWQPLHS